MTKGTGSAQVDNPVWREDFIAALCATAVVVGLFIDGWNHINLQNGALGSFFTPWHGVLYAGFSLSAGWIFYRNSHLVRSSVAPRPEYHTYAGKPFRYPLALFGIGISTFGMAGDAVWHTLLGEERGVARVISPFHLVLFSGAALLLAAPLRSGWYATRVYPTRLSLGRFLPPLLSLTLLTASIAFMFQWLSAFIEWEPSLVLGHLPADLATNRAVVGTAEFAGVSRILITNIVLLAPVLLALRRWRLPAGSITFVFTTVAFAMSTLTEFRQGWMIAAAIIGGVAGDVFVVVLRPSPLRPLAMRLFAALTAAVLWTSYFIIQRVSYDIKWPFDLWVGTAGVTAICAVLLSVLVLPSLRPPLAWGAATGESVIALSANDADASDRTELTNEPAAPA